MIEENKYYKSFDCDGDPMYIELHEKFYDENKKDIDDLLKFHKRDSIVDSMNPRDETHSMYYEDCVLEFIYCMKCEKDKEVKNGV